MVDRVGGGREGVVATQWLPLSSWISNPGQQFKEAPIFFTYSHPITHLAQFMRLCKIPLYGIKFSTDGI